MGSIVRRLPKALLSVGFLVLPLLSIEKKSTFPIAFIGNGILYFLTRSTNSSCEPLLGCDFPRSNTANSIILIPRLPELSNSYQALSSTRFPVQATDQRTQPGSRKQRRERSDVNIRLRADDGACRPTHLARTSPRPWPMAAWRRRLPTSHTAPCRQDGAGKKETALRCGFHGAARRPQPTFMPFSARGRTGCTCKRGHAAWRC